MLTLLSIGVATLYDTIGFFAGKHWGLSEDETITYANAINRALDTLPGEYYALIRKIVESWFPWLTLAVIAAKVTIPRYQYTVEQWSQPRKPESNQTVNPEQTQTVPGDAGNGVAGDTGWNKYRSTASFRSGSH